MTKNDINPNLLKYDPHPGGDARARSESRHSPEFIVENPELAWDLAYAVKPYRDKLAQLSISAAQSDPSAKVLEVRAELDDKANRVVWSTERDFYSALGTTRLDVKKAFEKKILERIEVIDEIVIIGDGTEELLAERSALLSRGSPGVGDYEKIMREKRKFEYIRVNKELRTLKDDNTLIIKNNFGILARQNKLDPEMISRLFSHIGELNTVIIEKSLGFHFRREWHEDGRLELVVEYTPPHQMQNIMEKMGEELKGKFDKDSSPRERMEYGTVQKAVETASRAMRAAYNVEYLSKYHKSGLTTH